MGFVEEEYKTIYDRVKWCSSTNMLQRTVVLVAICVASVFGSPRSRSISPLLDGRIVGGDDADIRDYPYTVSLQYRNSHYCGGVIISPEWVLSAAHCVIGYPISIFTIRAGTSAHNSGGESIPLARIVAHPEYDDITIDYDITALQLSSPITSSNAAPIPIAPAGPGPVAGATATITGWGTLTEGGNIPTVLQVVRIPVVSQLSCRQAYGNYLVSERMFCAGETEGGRDACQGDSGGPVVVSGAVTGLVSWGAGCARPNYPGVNTNLPALRDWIEDTTGV